MDRKRQHYESEPGQRAGRRSDELEQRENKRGRHAEHPAASLPPSLQRRLQWLDEEPQQQERNSNQQQHGPHTQGSTGQREDPRSRAERPPPRQRPREGRPYNGRTPAGPQHQTQQQQQQQQQQHLSSGHQQQQQQQRSPRRGSQSAPREARGQRDPQQDSRAPGLDRQGSRGGVFDRLGQGSESHPGDTSDQQYAGRDSRGSSSRPRQAESPGRRPRAQGAGDAASDRGYQGSYEYDKERDRPASSAHGRRDGAGTNVAGGTGGAPRPRCSTSPRQRRHSDQGEQRQYSGQRGGRSSSPGGARRQGSDAEGHQGRRSADRTTPERRVNDPGSSSRRNSGSRDKSYGSNPEQQQQQREEHQQQQKAAVAHSSGAVEPPPSTGVSKKSTGSRHTPIVFNLAPAAPGSERDLLPLRSSSGSMDKGRGVIRASGQAAGQEHPPPLQQQRAGSAAREHPTEQVRSDSRRGHQQEPPAGVQGQRRGEERPISPPSSRARDAGREGPSRRNPQLSPEPFKRPGAAAGEAPLRDRDDSFRRGQEVDRSRERGGRGAGGSSSEHWRGQVQPAVDGSSRDRGARGRNDQPPGDDWSWRPEDVQQQSAQPPVKQPMVVTETKPSHLKQQQQQHRVEGQKDWQTPGRPVVGSPRTAGHGAAATGHPPPGRGQQAEPRSAQSQQQRERPGLPDTPAAERQVLRQQRDARRAAAVQQHLRVMHFSKAFLEPHAWRELLKAADLPEEAVDSTLATTQRMSAQASRLRSHAGAASLPLPDQAPLSSVLGNAGTEAHLHQLQESIDAYSHTAQQPWCKALGGCSSLMMGQEFEGLLW